MPTRDVEDPVTKEFLRAELSDMELRLTGMFHSELRAEIRRTVWINLGTLVAFAGVIIAAVRL